MLFFLIYTVLIIVSQTIEYKSNFHFEEIKNDSASTQQQPNF